MNAACTGCSWSPVRDALDGEDLGAVVADRQRQARIDPPAVDQHRAGAALAAVAALLGAGQVQPLAQEIEQRDARVVELDSRRTPLTVRLMEKFMQVLRSMLWSNLNRRCWR